MKKHLTLTIALFIIYGIHANAQKYTINANFSGFKNGTKFYLKDLDADLDIDSTEIIDGKFTMQKSLSTVKSFWLYARPTKQEFIYTNLLIGPDKIQLKGDIKDFPRDVIKNGSKSQDVANILNNHTKALWGKRDSIVNIIAPYLLGLKPDTAKHRTQALSKEMKSIDSNLNNITLNFIKQHTNSHAGLQELYWKRNEIDKVEFTKLFSTVSTALKSSSFGQRISNYIKVGNPVKKGDLFFDFEAKDLNNKVYRISNFKGKYILLDFTETYCGPCILSADALNALNTKYADSLQIISFYAEKNKAVMQEGIKRDQPKWLCIWDGKGSDSEITLKYGVSGYPTFVLIDPEGKIVSRFSGFGKNDDGSSNLEKEINRFLQKDN
ncbi:redoxin family protein [Pedobacter sp.]|uniref:redoxin family protein n=1 Tax=Pedobacter sp. TaxID=1411316 RepID=UPI00396C3FE6